MKFADVFDSSDSRFEMCMAASSFCFDHLHLFCEGNYPICCCPLSPVFQEWRLAGSMSPDISYSKAKGSCVHIMSGLSYIKSSDV